MATTPNFNWSTPDNTGLVKNGALDIRTLGNSIDASLVDLKGGTTGQVLSKASNTDMDFTWATDASGIPATIFDAKGDIIAATAADTASRLAVGANNTVLTADSSTATGLKWAAPSGGTLPILTTVQPSGDFSTSSTSYVDITNITITRTPVSATNKIEIKLSYVCPVSTGLQLDLRAFQGATSIGTYTYEVEYNGGSPDTINAIWYVTNVPASSTTFKVQAKVSTGTITFYGTATGYANGYSTLEIY